MDADGLQRLVAAVAADVPQRGQPIAELFETIDRLSARLSLTAADRATALAALTKKQRRLLSVAKPEMNQAELAAVLHVDQSNVSRMINNINKTLPTYLMLAAKQASRVHSN